MTESFLDQVLRDGFDGRAVEGERGWQRPTGALLQTVSQIDGHERIETQIAQALVRTNLVGLIKAENLQGLLADVAVHNRRALAGSRRRQPLEQFRFRRCRRGGLCDGHRTTDELSEEPG